MKRQSVVPGAITHGEIFHQPDLWPDTVARVRSAANASVVAVKRPVLAGAGSSAYAATAIAAAWPGARAIATTDLLLDARTGDVPEIPADGLLISIARSGDSPESVGVVELIRRVRPDVRHLALMCNEQGRLARTNGVSAILLDPRTNNRSLAVTSGYSNLVLAGLALRQRTDGWNPSPTSPLARAPRWQRSTRRQRPSRNHRYPVSRCSRRRRWSAQGAKRR